MVKIINLPILLSIRSKIWMGGGGGGGWGGGGGGGRGLVVPVLGPYFHQSFSIVLTSYPYCQDLPVRKCKFIVQCHEKTCFCISVYCAAYQSLCFTTHGVQRRKVLVDNFFDIFQIIIFCLVADICDPVHDVEAIHGLC